MTYEENDIKTFEKKVEFECAQEIIKRIQQEFEVDLGNESLLFDTAPDFESEIFD